MLDLRLSTKFKKDYARCRKRQYDMELLQSVVDVLRIPAPLPPANKDHPLGGEWIDRRECHIRGDWLLIYHVIGTEDSELSVEEVKQLEAQLAKFQTV